MKPDVLSVFASDIKTTYDCLLWADMSRDCTVEQETTIKLLSGVECRK